MSNKKENVKGKIDPELFLGELKERPQDIGGALLRAAERSGVDVGVARFWLNIKKREVEFGKRYSEIVRNGMTGQHNRIEEIDGLEDWKLIWAERYGETLNPAKAAEGFLSKSQIYKRLRPGDPSFDEELYDLKQSIDFEIAHGAISILNDGTKLSYKEGDWRTAINGAQRLAAMMAPSVFGNRVTVDGQLNHVHRLESAREKRMRELAESQVEFQLSLSEGNKKLVEGSIDAEYVDDD